MSVFQEMLSDPADTVMTLHRKPDGDSIASNLALKNLLSENGHNVTIYSKDPVPQRFSYLDGVAEIHVTDPATIPWQEYKRYLAVDMSSLDMVGSKISLPASLDVWSIDHHATNVFFGNTNIVRPTDISAASVVFDLYEEVNAPINKSIATTILTGIATDSGFFTYQENKDAKPFEQAAKLMQLEGDYQRIIDELLNTIPFADIQFIGKAFLQSREIPDKKTVIIPVDYDLWKNEGVSADKNIHLAHFASRIDGTEVGIVLIEEEPKRIRVELRSRKNARDVSEIAVKLGGGGHIAAAGAMIHNATLAEVEKQILDLL